LASWGDKAKPPVVCLTWPAALLFLNFGLFVPAVTSQKIDLQLDVCALTPQGQRRPYAG
jgi:hypothetical protein